jgi:hypothetical protein
MCNNSAVGIEGKVIYMCIVLNVTPDGLLCIIADVAKYTVRYNRTGPCSCKLTIHSARGPYLVYPIMYG